MKAVVMAGGDGVRLRPFTYLMPKPLLPIGEMTVIENTIKTLKLSGFSEIIITTYYQAEKFNVCCEYAEKYDIKVVLHQEQEKMGTAGALAFLRDTLKESFCLLNGDLFIGFNLSTMIEFHEKKNADVTVGITEYIEKIPYAVVRRNEQAEIVELIEKPSRNHFVNCGVYILSPSIFRYIPLSQRIDMPEVLNKMKEAQGRILGFDVGGKWIDVGRISDYEKAVALIERGFKD